MKAKNGKSRSDEINKFSFIFLSQPKEEFNSNLLGIERFLLV